MIVAFKVVQKMNRRASKSLLIFAALQKFFQAEEKIEESAFGKSTALPLL